MAVGFPGITLSSGTNSASIAQPYFGYTCDIDLPFHVEKKADGHYSSWDDGTTYDKYMFTGTFYLTAAQQSTMETLITTKAQGRGSNLTLTCVSGQGFYPFSPLKGDTGDFTVAVAGFIPFGIGEAPYKYFKTTIKLLATAFPAYALPADATDYGNFKIGTVSNVRFPEKWFTPKTTYNIDVGIPAQASEVDYLDFGEDGDRYDTEMELDCSTTKLGRVLNYIVGTSRASAVQCVTDTDSYMFGRDKNGNATYNCVLIDNVLRVKHNTYDRWSLNMSMSWNSTV
jgi:hypothetical protein